MKVAVVGLAHSTHDRAPFDDPDWQCWGLPWDGHWSSFDRLFEMHDRGLLESEGSGRGEEYWERLCHDIGVPVYMHQHWPDIPHSIPYPLESVRNDVFRGFPRWDQDDWYNSSPAYMIALAIHEGADTVGIWGVDVLDDSEYAYESPCLEYLIGLAVGKGIEVVIPEGPTALGKFRSSGIKLGRLNPVYHKRYGYVA